jgi:hypothetical protein
MYSLSIQSVAEHREYDDEKFQEKLIIPASSLKTIDLEFKEGKELELIYGLQVKEGLPIDVFFVNNENYNKFVIGGEFAYFIDGSEQNVIADTKIVGVKEYNSYKLILANYNNQTVEIDIIYETRIYKAESSDDSSEDSFFSDLAYPLLIVVIILAALLILLIVKTRRLKQTEPEVTNKAGSRKSKNHKKSKKSRPPKREAKPSKMVKKEAKPTKREDKRKALSKKIHEGPGFCGYCGKSGDTPYCKYCGKKV